MSRHAASLHAVATRTLGDAALAEDVVQETFLKAWETSRNWEPGRARFSTWLHRVTVNRCLDHLRRKRPLIGVEMPEPADMAPLADRRLMRDEEDERMRAAINCLPDRQRAALSLSLYDGLSQREASATLGITEKAYESLLVRARRSLRTQMLETMQDAAQDTRKGSCT